MPIQNITGGCHHWEKTALAKGHMEGPHGNKTGLWSKHTETTGETTGAELQQCQRPLLLLLLSLFSQPHHLGLSCSTLQPEALREMGLDVGMTSLLYDVTTAALPSSSMGTTITCLPAAGGFLQLNIAVEFRHNKIKTHKGKRHPRAAHSQCAPLASEGISSSTGPCTSQLHDTKMNCSQWHTVFLGLCT